MLTFCEIKFLEMAADLAKLVKLKDSCAFDQQPRRRIAN